MPVTKNAAFRHRIINSCLRSTRNRFPSIEDIQQTVTEALNLDSYISISSLNKDMKAMRDFYQAPIKYDKLEKGYYYEDADFSINDFPLSPEEIKVLDMSTSFLKQIKYSGYFQQFESVIEKLISGFRISKIPGYEKRNYLETEEPTADTGIGWIEKVYEAIINKQVLSIGYKRFNSIEIKVHQLSPYVIREYRNRWYVTGFSERAKVVTTLALDRVIEMEISESGYKETAGFDEATFFKYSFGATVFANAKPYKVQLLFNKTVAGYLLTKPIHPSQVIIGDGDDLTIEIECYLTPELEMTILSYGENVKVLAPQEMIERVKERIAAMGSVYL